MGPNFTQVLVFNYTTKNYDTTLIDRQYSIDHLFLVSLWNRFHLFCVKYLNSSVFFFIYLYISHHLYKEVWFCCRCNTEKSWLPIFIYLFVFVGVERSRSESEYWAGLVVGGQEERLIRSLIGDSHHMIRHRNIFKLCLFYNH